MPVAEVFRHATTLARARLDDERTTAAGAGGQAGEQVCRRHLRRASREAATGETSGERFCISPSCLHTQPEWLVDDAEMLGRRAQPLGFRAGLLVDLPPSDRTL